MLALIASPDRAGRSKFLDSLSRGNVSLSLRRFAYFLDRARQMPRAEIKRSSW